MKTALEMNNWMDKDELKDMIEADLKAALIANLNEHLDSEAHSMPELSYRYYLLTFQRSLSKSSLF